MKNVVKATVAAATVVTALASTASAQQYDEAYFNSIRNYYGGTNQANPNTVTITNRGGYALTVRPVDWSSSQQSSGVSVGQSVSYTEDVMVQVQCLGYGETRYNVYEVNDHNKHVRITYWGSCFDATASHDLTNERPLNNYGEHAPTGLRYWAN